jgi:iron complex transport system substrate-binding protein
MSQKLLLVLVISTLVLSACALPTAFPPPIVTAAATEMVAAAPSAPEALSVESPSGQPAQRIVSLAPSNTEILFAIGASSQLVGRDSFSDYPVEAAQIADIGGGFTALNMEVIVSKEPDLILAAPLTPPEQIAALENVGLNVYVLPNPTTFDDLYANLQTVAELTGHEAEAQTLVVVLKGRVNAIIGQVAAATERPLVYYELDATDPNAPYISGPGTFVHVLIESAGGANFGADLSGEWVQVSVEQLLARQPDVIVLGDHTYGGVTPEQVRLRAGWDALTAVQENRIFIFDDNLVSRPGPRLVDGLETMAKLLHPDLVR